MELINGWLLFILIPLIIAIFILRFKNNTKYDKGIKVANTKITRNIPHYKLLLRKYKIYKILLIGSYATLFLLLSLLIARPAKVNKNDTVIYNRDIVICMDVSGSVLTLNKEIVKTMKDTVKRLKNERFAISIFNTTSVLLVPLTDDYEYTLEMLDKIEKSLEIAITEPSYADITRFTKEEEELFYLLRDGTVYDAEIHGSSLIGDGLASCVYSFSNLEEKRSRTIIFSTDNEIQNIGEVLVTIDEAAKLSKNKDVIVYGIATTNIKNNDYLELSNAIKKTGGQTYKSSSGSTVKSIVDNIERQLTSETKLTEVRKIDIPQIPFYIVIFLILLIMFFDRKVKG